jgi:hypothetical protein
MRITNIPFYRYISFANEMLLIQTIENELESYIKDLWWEFPVDKAIDIKEYTSFARRKRKSINQTDVLKAYFGANIFKYATNDFKNFNEKLSNGGFCFNKILDLYKFK